MAEKYSFFDSVDSDRIYFAADWALHLSKYFTNGIFNNGLRVVANGDMTVSVEIGDANINGYRYTNDTEKVITVANADGVLDRVDNIVIRLDLVNRQITAEIVQGTFAETAVAPALVRGSSVYDLRIAKISVPAGTTEITTQLIEDTRFNDSDCGNVICAVTNPDFSNILAQYTAIWNAFIENETEDFETWFAEKTSSFDEWFQEIRDQLDSDAAGHLQLEIDNLEALIMEAIAPITTEDGDNIVTEDNELIIRGM